MPNGEVFAAFVNEDIPVKAKSSTLVSQQSPPPPSAALARLELWLPFKWSKSNTLKSCLPPLILSKDQLAASIFTIENFHYTDSRMSRYSVFTRDIESEAGTNLLPACRELGVALVVAAPLGRGLLTSTFSKGEAVGDSKDFRPQVMPRFQEGNREQNVKIVAKFKALADKKGCTVSQLALAWLLKQGDDIFPTPGTKQIKYMEENWGALDVNLTDEEEKDIRGFGEANEFAGWHNPPQFASYLFRDTKEESG